jgi:potassium-dependent mechanosensitive channel
MKQNAKIQTKIRASNFYTQKLQQRKLFWTIALILSILLWMGYKQYLKISESIHIAVIGPLSGEGARSWQLSVQAIQLYFDKINQKGGINGKIITLDMFDDQNDPQQAKAKALEIVEQNQAVAVIGHHYSACSISGGEVYLKYGIPALSTHSTNVKVTENNPWYFRTIFDDNLQGRFLAHYAKKVLGYETVTIIHKDRTDGNYLAEVFKQTAHKLEMNVQYDWAFDENNHDINQVLSTIVEKLQTVKDNAGLIFLAAHTTEAIKLVKLIKDAGIPNPILMSEDLASINFQQGFNEFPKEKVRPGYYTNGLYVATPIIFDTANEKAQQFKEIYQATYQEEPDEATAFAYDAAMVIVEAIKNTSIKGRAKTLKEDRQKIRDYLAKLTSIENGLEGVSGLNYFDQQGNAQKPISIGLYKNRNIISASTQLQMVSDINEIANLDTALEKEHLLLIDDKYLYKTNVVYVGIELNEISELDTKNLTYLLDFYLWFRFQGDIETQKIDFINAAEPITLTAPIIEKEGIQTRHLYRIKGRFKADFLSNHVYYKQHILGISFHHQDLTLDNLIYVTDVLGMGLTKGEFSLEKVKNAQVLSSVYDWSLTHALFFQDIIQKSALGSIKYLNVETGTIDYSRFNAAIQINQNEFTLRRVIPPHWAHYLLILTSVLIVLIILYEKKFDGFKKIILFFHALLIFIILLSSEVLLIDQFVAENNTYYLKTIVRIFDVLWWITPAFLLNLLIERFIWLPLEQRTGRTIPNVVRLFLASIIYLLASFGIIAFVYEQPLTSLLATSGVVAMIVGLAIQVNIANVFSGIVINLERPFRVHDWVQIQMGKVITEGQVVDITWRTTRILNKDGYILSIPNSLASEAIVHNYNYPDDPCKTALSVRIDYAHSPDKVEKILLDAVLSVYGILNEPEPSASFNGFSDWAADYSVSFYVGNYALQNEYKKKVFKRIWIHLQRAGILPAVQRQEIHAFKGVKERGREAAIKPKTVLQEIAVFQAFSEKHQNDLSERMRYHCFPAGETIVQQGETGHSLFIIVEGVVSIYIELKNNDSMEVTRLGAGNFFGEIALLTDQERTATAIAMTTTHLFEIVQPDILPLLQEEPKVSERISEVLSQRLMRSEYQLKQEHDVYPETEVIYKRLFRGILNFFGLG